MAARPLHGPPEPVDYVCNMCGGNEVTRDAWASWGTAAQDWTLGAAFDYAFCHDCEQETNLVEVDLATREPTGDQPGPAAKSLSGDVRQLPGAASGH